MMRIFALPFHFSKLSFIEAVHFFPLAVIRAMEGFRS
jgi:hypothetical protein